MRNDPTICVANPGTHPELAHLAGGIAARGYAVQYFTAASYPPSGYTDGFVRRSTPRVQLYAGQRRLPASLTASHVRMVAVGAEAIFQASKFVSPRRASAMLARRNQRFQAEIVKYVASKPNLEVVIAQHTVANPIFEAARKSHKVLNCPLPHHRWLRDYLAHEAIENPEWAEHLQGNDESEANLTEWDSEVASADTLLVASSFVKKTFELAGVQSDRIVVSGLGSDGHSSSHGVSASHAHHNKLRILFVGQLNQRKGIGYLVEALEGLPSQSLELRLIGPSSQEMRTALRARGYDPEPAATKVSLAAAYEWADLLVLPSLAEGFGLVLTEAMAAGCPVLTTTHTGAPDFVQNEIDGFIIEPKDSLALSRVLRRCIENRSLLSSFRRSLSEREDFPSWERYAERALDQLTVKWPHAT